jgi:MFS family permease
MVSSTELLLHACTWCTAINNTPGIFQSYYRSDLLVGYAPSAISWIGTITSFFLCASPLMWGPIFDRGSVRILVFVGSGAVVFGLIMSSVWTTYWHLILAQGIVVGLGGGCTFLTATSILPTYFAKKRSLVMGIAASGSSMGGIIYPIVFHQLNGKIGFPWTVRVIGFIALATLAIPCAVIKPRVPKPTMKRKIIDFSLLRELPFGLINIATFFGFVGQYIPFFFIENFAEDVGNQSKTSAFWMIIVLNAGSLPGRIIPSLIADKFFPPLVVLGCCTGCATILAFCWAAVQDSYAGLVIWALLYGFCAGAFVSLQGPCVASMTTDMRSIGSRFGINMFCGALGILIGSPVGGAIFPTSWPGAGSFCGGTLLMSTVFIAATYWAHNREKTRGQSRLSG